MNIWIFNHYAQGPELPGGTRHYDLAKKLIENGHKVTIFAAGFHYTLMHEFIKYDKNGCALENKKGVKFVWVKTYPYKANNWKRVLNIVSYAFRLNFLIPKLNLDKPDIIIGSTVHPFSSYIASRFAKKFKIMFVFEIRDLWPQTFIDMGIWEKNSLITKAFKYVEKITISRSQKTIVLSPITIEYLVKEYKYEEKNILLLPNGVNNNFFRKAIQNFRKKINITYLGGIDKVHGLEYLIELAYELKASNILFNIYGDGKERENLEKMQKNKRLHNVVFHGSVPKINVPNKLEEANLLFVSTSNVLYGSENKLYEYMAIGKPIIVATNGNHNNPIKDIGCGISLDRSDVKLSAIILLDFIENKKNNFEQLGRIGQNYVLKNRTIDILSEKLEDFIM